LIILHVVQLFHHCYTLNVHLFADAIKMYTQAIAGDSQDATLFANRSAACLASGLYDQALADAQKATELKPTWPKSHYRLGCAAAALNQWELSAASLQTCARLASTDKEVQTRLREAKARADEAKSARLAAAATERRRLVLQLRAARQADQRLVMMNQFKQSMTAPDWELEDLEWLVAAVRMQSM
jgi:tetratricopeptide (TPR) repeat protein